MDYRCTALLPNIFSRLWPRCCFSIWASNFMSMYRLPISHHQAFRKSNFHKSQSKCRDVPQHVLHATLGLFMYALEPFELCWTLSINHYESHTYLTNSTSLCESRLWALSVYDIIDTYRKSSINNNCTYCWRVASIPSPSHATQPLCSG